MIRGLEIGVNDYLMRPIDKNELLARVRTQIRKKRYTERLRDNVQHVDRDGDHRCADRPVQPPLHGEPSGDAGRAGGRARQAADRAGARHRLLQGDQRHPRPRRRRRRAARVRHRASASRSAASISPAATAARSSSSSCRKPTWRSPPSWPSGCAGASPPSRFRSQQGARRDRGHDLDRHRHARHRRRQRRPASSSAPTRRSIAPSATAATASSPTRRNAFCNFPQLLYRAIRACRARVNHNHLG